MPFKDILNRFGNFVDFMKRRIYYLIISLIITLSGCVDRSSVEEETVLSEEEQNQIAMHAAKNNYKDLYAGQFYVWHDENANDIANDLIDDEKELNEKFKDYEYKIFTPLYYADGTFNLNTNAYYYFGGQNRISWLTDEDDSMVPVLHPGDALVFYTESDVPSSFTFEKFNELGYSIGISNLSKDGSGHFFTNINTTGFCDTSSAYQILYDITSNRELKATKIIIDTINDVPINSSYVDENYGYITGLEANKEYSINAYYGTVHNNFTITADCKVLGSSPVTEEEEKTFSQKLYSNDENLDSTLNEIPLGKHAVVYSYTLYNSTIAVVKLPENIEDGYYLVNGSGFFRYDSSIKNNIEEE